MPKKLKFIQLTNLITIITLCPLTMISCDKQQHLNGYHYLYSEDEIKAQAQEANGFQNYYQLDPNNQYRTFIINQNYRLKNQRSNSRMSQYDNAFDNLYDCQTTPNVWRSFANLELSLTQTRLSSSVVINLNGNQILQQVKLSQFDINFADQLLLRFYNIIAKVYQTASVLSLVQKIKIDPNLSSSLAFTRYFYQANALIQKFSTIFANQSHLSSLYQSGDTVSDDLIVAIIHEYAHALSCYVLNNDQQRREFNTLKVPDIEHKVSNNEFLKLKSDCYQSSVFHDPTSVLINFLNLTAHIDGQDPIENMIFPLLVVSSRYGEVAWKYNIVKMREELFAEAFARGITTLKTNRNYQGQLLNKFFISFFPNYYRL